MEQPQVEEQRVETATQEEPSREGGKRTTKAERLVQDARENLGAPSNQYRKGRSPDRYTDYMDLVTELVDTKSSNFKEVIEKLVWVDVVAEE